MVNQRHAVFRQELMDRQGSVGGGVIVVEHVLSTSISILLFFVSHPGSWFVNRLLFAGLNYMISSCLHKLVRWPSDDLRRSPKDLFQCFHQYYM